MICYYCKEKYLWNKKNITLCLTILLLKNINE